jgi:hypothetical protein
MHILTGTLPWQGLRTPKMTKDEWYGAIAQCKSEFDVPEFFSSHPPEFIQIHRYIRSIKFDQKPDYDYIRKEIKGMMKACRISPKTEFEWVRHGTRSGQTGTLQIPAGFHKSENRTTEKRS